jgi:hypothetical protein
MADLVYNDITQFTNSPMHRLVLTDEQTPTDRLQFFYPTKESSYEVAAITRRDGYGAERPTGWMFEGQFVTAINAQETILSALNGWPLRDIDVKLVLKPDSSQSHGRLVTIRLRPPVGLVWFVRKGEHGPELVIRITKALMSLYQNFDGTAYVKLFTDDTEIIPEP